MNNMPSSAHAGPERNPEPTFQSSDGNSLDPRRSLENLGDDSAVNAGEPSDLPEAAVTDGITQPDGDTSHRLGVLVTTRDLRPVVTEGAGRPATRAGHALSLPTTGRASSLDNLPPLEVRSTSIGDTYRHIEPEELARILKKIDAFVPKIDPADWALIESFVRDAVRDAGPDRYTTAQPWLSNVAQFVQWSVKVEGLELNREVIFHPANIFDFVAQRPAKSDAANGTTRSILLRISARLIGEHAGASEDRRSYNGSIGRKPYTSAEKIGLLSFIHGQRTGHRRTNLEVVVAFAAGAGLTAVEILQLTPDHVEDRGDLILVHIPGAKSRTVPVLAYWEPLMRHVLAAAEPDGPLVLRNYVKYRQGNAIADFLWTCNGDGVRPHCQRLRSTWIVDHLNACTPVDLLLKLAGVGQMSTLQRYLPFVKKRKVEDNFAALRLEGTDE